MLSEENEGMHECMDKWKPRAAEAIKSLGKVGGCGERGCSVLETGYTPWKTWNFEHHTFNEKKVQPTVKSPVMTKVREIAHLMAESYHCDLEERKRWSKRYEEIIFFNPDYSMLHAFSLKCKRRSGTEMEWVRGKVSHYHILWSEVSKY